MRRLFAFIGALVLLSGCAGDGHQWDEFWKDLRGENMEMHAKGPIDKDLYP